MKKELLLMSGTGAATLSKVTGHDSDQVADDSDDDRGSQTEAVGGFVAVHVGAGYHSPANSELYKNICRHACLQAMSLFREKKSSLEACKVAMMALEDSPWTNAGRGSNLTVKGTVECDASIMDGESLQYGSVGAVSGVRNPILVAENLLQTQLLGNMSLGRIPPSLLVGQGAYEWAVKSNIPTIDSNVLVTDSSQKAFIKHKRKLDMLEEGMNHVPYKLRKIESQVNGADGAMDEVPAGQETRKVDRLVDEEKGEVDRLLDTVGAICVDHTGRVVSAVSSGGIVLKQPGRLGQAAMYGCGCWAENDLQQKTGVGVSTSGCGEHLTKALMAKECADCLKKSKTDPTTALHQTFKTKFLSSPFLRTVQQKLGGCLSLKAEIINTSQLQVEILWAHTTDSMCLAFMSTNDKQPTALVSRLPEGSKCGRSCLVQSKVVNIPLNIPSSEPGAL